MKITKPKWLKNYFIRFHNIDNSNKFIRNIGIIWTAVFLFLFIPEELINFFVSEKGTLVNIRIAEMPDNCGGKYMHASFDLNDKIITKRVWKSFCNDYKLGDSVPMYFHPSFPNNSLLETERGLSIKIELFACFILLLFGMFMIKYAYKSS